jgi:hypothetical protein
MEQDLVLTLTVTVEDEAAVWAAARGSTAAGVQGVREAEDIASGQSRRLEASLVTLLGDVLGDLLVEGKLPGVIGVGVSIIGLPTDLP